MPRSARRARPLSSWMRPRRWRASGPGRGARRWAARRLRRRRSRGWRPVSCALGAGTMRCARRAPQRRSASSVRADVQRPRLTARSRERAVHCWQRQCPQCVRGLVCSLARLFCDALVRWPASILRLHACIAWLCLVVLRLELLVLVLSSFVCWVIPCLERSSF